MAANKIHDGNVLSLTLAANVASGAIVIAGKIVGVALTDGASGATIPVDTVGVYRLPKVSANVITVGATVYATAAGEITTTAASNTKAGYAIEAAAGTTTEVAVRLVPAS